MSPSIYTKNAVLFKENETGKTSLRLYKLDANDVLTSKIDNLLESCLQKPLATSAVILACVTGNPNVWQNKNFSKQLKWGNTPILLNPVYK